MRKEIILTLLVILLAPLVYATKLLKIEFSASARGKGYDDSIINTLRKKGVSNIEIMSAYKRIK